MASPTVLYTRPDCSYSDALKYDLERDGVTFDEIDLSIYPEKITELEGLTGGERITPVLVVNGEVTVGYHGIG
ncbi:MAG: Glutaredoxin [Chloroflexi bacterium]|nr:MAG: Glutaredoxin [Chloroflexota bacterium]